MTPKERVRERVNSLPEDVWDCERCNSEDSMQLRRSSLNEQFLADDVGLKCAVCRYYATHGIPFDDPAHFHEERSMRGSRVLDFTRVNGEPDKEQLRALGYLGASKQ